MWISFIKPGSKIATRINSAGVAAKTKNPQSTETTSITLKSITGRKMTSLTDKRSGSGLTLKVI